MNLPSETIVKKRSRKIAFYFALAVLFISILVLMGWQFNIGFLKRPLPNLVAMNPTTAVCFILSALSFLFLVLDKKFARQYFAGRIFAIIALLIGVLKIVSVFSHIDIPVDTILFQDRFEADLIGNISNSMAPNTSICFILSAISLLSINGATKKRIATSQYFALFTGLICLLSVLGYFYHVKRFYDFLAYIPMSLHTAISFLLLSFAILFAHPDYGFMKGFTGPYAGSRTARRLIPLAILIPILFGYVRLLGQRSDFYTSDFGVTLLVISIIIIFIAGVWYNMILLNRTDLKNKQAEVALRDRTSQLEAANKELESFSYSVSHDLRAPLRIIDGYAEILTSDYKDKLDNEGNRTLGIIKVNARKMGQLIDDLLNLSKFGRKELVIHEIDMTQLVTSVIKELLLENKDRAEIKIATLEAANGDSNLMRQAWINLISNAIKYSAKNEKPFIDINSYKDGSEIVYSIKDNGVGFDMKYSDKLFGVFQRLHKVSEFEGTGVGLVLVKTIINKHGGKVWAQSEVNKGATFFFSLPG